MKRQELRLYVNLALVAACSFATQSGTVSAALLYSIDRQGHQLVKLDTVAQTITPIGTGLGQVYPTVSSTDLTIANDRLYAVDTSISPPGPVNVLEIDTVTGLAVSSVLVTCP